MIYVCIDFFGVFVSACSIDSLALTHQLQLPSTSVMKVLSLHALPGNQGVLVVASKADCCIIYICRQPHLGMVVGEAVVEVFKVFRCYSSALVQSGDR